MRKKIFGTWALDSKDSNRDPFAQGFILGFVFLFYWSQFSYCIYIEKREIERTILYIYISSMCSYEWELFVRCDDSAILFSNFPGTASSIVGASTSRVALFSSNKYSSGSVQTGQTEEADREMNKEEKETNV